MGRRAFMCSPAIESNFRYLSCSTSRSGWTVIGSKLPRGEGVSSPDWCSFRVAIGHGWRRQTNNQGTDAGRSIGQTSGHGPEGEGALGVAEQPP
jgi:hypothetical protein